MYSSIHFKTCLYNSDDHNDGDDGLDGYSNDGGDDSSGVEKEETGE